MRESVEQNQNLVSVNRLEGKMPSVSADTKASVEPPAKRKTDPVLKNIQSNLNRYQALGPINDTARLGGAEHLKRSVHLRAEKGFSVALGSKQVKAIELDKNFKAWTKASIENDGLAASVDGEVSLENLEGVVLKLRQPQFLVTQVDLKEASITKSDQPGKVNLHIKHSFGDKTAVVSANAPEVKLLRQIALRLVEHKAGIVQPKPLVGLPEESIARTN